MILPDFVIRESFGSQSGLCVFQRIPTANDDDLADRAGLSPIGSAPSALSASGAERSEEYGSWLSTPTTTGGTPSAQQPDDDAETSAEVRRDFGCNSGGIWAPVQASSQGFWLKVA